MSAETRGMTLKEYCIRSRRAELLQQWQYAKNDGLTPDAVTCHSRQKVWWIDRLGHEWQQEIYSRTALCRGCLFWGILVVLKGHSWQATIASRASGCAARSREPENPARLQ